MIFRLQIDKELYGKRLIILHVDQDMINSAVWRKHFENLIDYDTFAYLTALNGIVGVDLNCRKAVISQIRSTLPGSP